jgi:hypothetical protein
MPNGSEADRTTITTSALISNAMKEAMKPDTFVTLTNVDLSPNADYSMYMTLFENHESSFYSTFDTTLKPVIMYQPTGKIYADSTGRPITSNRLYIPETEGTIGLPQINDLAPVYYRRALVTKVKFDGVPIATTSDMRQELIPVTFCKAVVTDTTSIIPSVVKSLTGATVIESPAYLQAQMNAVKALDAHSAASLITSFIDASGTLLFQVLRNRQGMFIPRVGNIFYTNLVASFSNLTQSHQFSTVEYPNLIPSNPSAFVSREVSNYIAGTVADVQYSSYLDVKTVQKLNTQKKRRRQVVYGESHAAAAAAGAAVTAGGDVFSALVNLGQRAMINQNNLDLQSNKFKYDSALQSSAAQNTLNNISRQGEFNLLGLKTFGQIQKELQDRQLAFQSSVLNARLLRGNGPIGRKMF